jgi:hypothetical protein
MTWTIAVRDQRSPSTRPGVGPLGWSVARRLFWVAMACALLWLAVLWALS